MCLLLHPTSSHVMLRRISRLTFLVFSPLRCFQRLCHNPDTAQGENDGVFVSAQGWHVSDWADLVPQGGQPVPISHRHNWSMLGQHNLSSFPLFGTHSPEEEPGQPGGDKNSRNYNLPDLGKKKKPICLKEISSIPKGELRAAL